MIFEKPSSYDCLCAHLRASLLPKKLELPATLLYSLLRIFSFVKLIMFFFSFEFNFHISLHYCFILKA